MTMLKNKHLTFSLILIFLIVVSPMAKAQLSGPNVIIGNIGRVSCTLNPGVNGTAAPAFANATVQLQCGPANVVVATTTTNVSGIFTFLTQISVPYATFFSNCRVFVATPLASCNATLPPVKLASPLRVTNSLSTGFFNIILLLVPTGFIPDVVPFPSIPFPSVPFPSVPLPIN